MSGGLLPANQMLPDLVIALVGIGAELKRIIAFQISGLIDDEDRKGGREGPSRGGALSDSPVDRLRTLVEQKPGEDARTFDPYAAVAHHPFSRLEQGSAGRVM